MKVNELIKKLQDMPKQADVYMSRDEEVYLIDDISSMIDYEIFIEVI